MKTLVPAAGALMLALAVPMAVDAQDRGGGRGHGQERGAGDDRRGGEERARGGQDRRGGDDARAQGGGRDRGPPQQRVERQDRGQERRADVERGRGEAGRGQVRDVARAGPPDRIRNGDRPGRGGGRRDDRDAPRVLRVDDGPDVVFFRRPADRGLIAGCPPGLARKNNGCLPPGQARQIARDQARYDYLWRTWGDDRHRYRYDGGYLYRYDNGGSLLGWLPALGGALGLGNVWPAQYQYQAPSPYYTSYYRLPDRYDYRYADGVLYGVDRRTGSIGQVAALMTGQPWSVGQAMPVGYDVYNVPYGYRARYVDGPDRWYRYSDGYVYQVDPTTRLVQAVIQLLA